MERDYAAVVRLVRFSACQSWSKPVATERLSFRPELCCAPFGLGSRGLTARQSMNRPGCEAATDLVIPDA